MLLSVATALPRNVETTRANELIPSFFRTDAVKFLSLVEAYYNHMNEVGMPSAEINAITTLSDIDNISLKYFEQIENLIGKNVPNSRVMNRVQLYKIIIKYYNTRGSDDSVHSFFKIFFDELVTLIYPKDFLFDLSGGTWDQNEERYTKDKSFLSNRFKIADGDYWDEYSYVIKTNLDSSEWMNEYLSFVHPAGLKMFASILIEAISRNEWYSELNYEDNSKNNKKNRAADAQWLRALVPSYITDSKSVGYHTPRYQPGWLRDAFLRFLFVYTPSEDEELNHVVNYLLKILSGDKAINVRDQNVRHQYKRSEKFIDTCVLREGWLNKTIASANEDFSNTNSCRMLNISTIIDEQYTYELSSIDNSAQATQANWDSSEIDTGTQATQANWDSSSYEPL